MGVALWVVQVLLALAFVGSGGAKLAQPKDKLAGNMAWVEDFSQGTCVSSARWSSWAPSGFCCRR